MKHALAATVSLTRDVVMPSLAVFAVAQGCAAFAHTTSPASPTAAKAPAPSIVTRVPAPPIATQPPAPPTGTRSTAPISDGHGGWYAVLAPIALQRECSNAGGDHLTLVVTDPAPGMPQWVHLGGHDAYLPLHCEQRYIAHITRAAIPMKIEIPGWCVEGLPAYDAELTALAGVAPDEDLAKRLARAAVEGVSGISGIEPGDPTSDRGLSCYQRMSTEP